MLQAGVGASDLWFLCNTVCSTVLLVPQLPSLFYCLLSVQLWLRHKLSCTSCACIAKKIKYASCA